MRRSKSSGDVRESSDVRKYVTLLRAMKHERIFGKMVIYRGFWIDFCRLGLQCDVRLNCRGGFGVVDLKMEAAAVFEASICAMFTVIVVVGCVVVLLVSWWWGVVVKAMVVLVLQSGVIGIVVVVPTTAASGSDCLVMVTD
ncbi:Hypothetical predicted protein [Olea europaea subsp. europaea]|uniref:Transmembrane protein n=1 Tax=Olea europaea subsp. europaea TaxID=158383 RepID=A0A8S0TWH8_OLEEU|nr:Hypothetical predicted protein [Olea europaea subsp. europaea]